RHTRFSRDWSSDVCSSDLTSTSSCVTAITSVSSGTVCELEAGKRKSLLLGSCCVLEELTRRKNTRMVKISIRDTRLRAGVLAFLWCRSMRRARRDIFTAAPPEQAAVPDQQWLMREHLRWISPEKALQFPNWPPAQHQRCGHDP